MVVVVVAVVVLGCVVVVVDDGDDVVTSFCCVVFGVASGCFTRASPSAGLACMNFIAEMRELTSPVLFCADMVQQVC